MSTVKAGKRKKTRVRKPVTSLFLVLLFIVGLLIMMYPFISDFWNQMIAENLIGKYKGSVGGLSQEKLEKEYNKARAYNNEHTQNTILDVFSNSNEEGKEYYSLLNTSGDGVMGYLEIPRVAQRIVIYHGTDEKTLQKGCGHIAGTSLPVGGKNSHSVLAAHRGLPRAKLFTDIDQLRKGDKFFVFVLDKTLAYEVDQIKTVKPDCLNELQIEKGKDYVTLFTCTPYSVNTHRLLVRGHRIPYVSADNGTHTTAEMFKKYFPLALQAVMLMILVILAARKSRRKKALTSRHEKA